MRDHPAEELRCCWLPLAAAEAAAAAEAEEAVDAAAAIAVAAVPGVAAVRLLRPDLGTLCSTGKVGDAGLHLRESVRGDSDRFAAGCKAGREALEGAEEGSGVSDLHCN